MQNQNEQVYKLPVTIMRGGTSKGIYILESDLPENREEWDAILLRLMGSPDSKRDHIKTIRRAVRDKQDRPQ